MAILSSGLTDIGQKRSTNQDSICIYPKRNLYVVADGMGGHNGGDIASQMLVELVPKYVEENYDNYPIQEVATNSIMDANLSIYNYGQERKELKGMGTTVTAILFDGQNLLAMNVGDSRTYLINNKMIYQLSRDHSLVQEKLNLGIYDRQGAKADPQKNVLIRSVGFEPELDVDLYNYKVSRSDMFLLCSDGLHGKVSDEDIIFIINKFIPDPDNATQLDLDKTVKKLIDQANANGGQDNISVILVLAK